MLWQNNHSLTPDRPSTAAAISQIRAPSKTKSIQYSCCSSGGKSQSFLLQLETAVEISDQHLMRCLSRGLQYTPYNILSGFVRFSPHERFCLGKSSSPPEKTNCCRAVLESSRKISDGVPGRASSFTAAVTLYRPIHCTQQQQQCNSSRSEKRAGKPTDRSIDRAKLFNFGLGLKIKPKLKTRFGRSKGTDRKNEISFGLHLSLLVLLLPLIDYQVPDIILIVAVISYKLLDIETKRGFRYDMR